MARKTISRSRASVPPKHPQIEPTLSARIRLPRSWRVVTTRKLRASDADLARRTPRREVPEIRLSGAWLERIGFPKRRRYLISADREIEMIYLQADVSDAKARKRR